MFETDFQNAPNSSTCQVVPNSPHTKSLSAQLHTNNLGADSVVDVMTYQSKH